MSTRYMKKVYGNDVTLEKGVDDASDTEVPVTSNVKSKSFNVFDVVRRTCKHYHFISLWMTAMLMINYATVESKLGQG